MQIVKKLLYVSIFSVSWALLIFFNKIALNNGVKEIPFTIQTTFISASLLIIYNLLMRKEELKKVKIEHFKILVLIGVIVGTAYILGIYGLKLSTSINYGFLIKSTLVFTILLALIFLKEKIDRNKIILMIVFMSGAYLVSTAGKLIMPKIGDILILGAAFCYSSALIITKPLTTKIHPDVIGCGRVVFALLVLLFLIPILRLNFLEIIGPQYVLIVGFFSAVLAIFINKTISISSASYMTMMSMIVPVIVSVLSLVFLKEPMNIFQMVGGLLIIVSGLLTQKSNI